MSRCFATSSSETLSLRKWTDPSGNARVATAESTATIAARLALAGPLPTVAANASRARNQTARASTARRQTLAGSVPSAMAARLVRSAPMSA